MIFASFWTNSAIFLLKWVQSSALHSLMLAKNVQSSATITKCSLSIRASSVLSRWKCQKTFIFTTVITIRKRRRHKSGKSTTRPPETFCECCGSWAFWDQLSSNWETNQWKRNFQIFWAKPTMWLLEKNTHGWWEKEPSLRLQPVQTVKNWLSVFWVHMTRKNSR